MNGAFLGSLAQIERVFSPCHRAEVGSMLTLLDRIISTEELSSSLDELKNVEVILSTWGMPHLSEDVLDHLPRLKLVLYAAGDTRAFDGPFMARGIPIVSAWRANAIPVAEFTVAQILLAGKGFHQNVRTYRRSRDVSQTYRGPGNCGRTVSILGAGAVGAALIDLLKPFSFEIFAFDPFLSQERAAEMGVEKVTIKSAFERGDIVSNHLANNSSTQGIITEALLASMPPGATFINTGRGATVDAIGLERVLRGRQDLTALLDVTEPEPLPRDATLWDLDNVFISSHIAGSTENELGRMVELCIEELARFQRGEPLLHQSMPT
jgi:phosphoglycerate dehydrogenase-like enzyme